MRGVIGIFSLLIIFASGSETTFFEHIKTCVSNATDIYAEVACRCILECKNEEYGAETTCHEWRPDYFNCDCDIELEPQGYTCEDEEAQVLEQYQCHERYHFDPDVCHGNGACVEPDVCQCRRFEGFGRECVNSATDFFFKEILLHGLGVFFSEKYLEVIILLVCLIAIVVIVLAFCIYCCGLRQNIQKTIDFTQQKLSEKNTIQMQILFVQEVIEKLHIDNPVVLSKLKNIQNFFFKTKSWKDNWFVSSILNLYFDIFFYLRVELRKTVEHQMRNRISFLIFAEIMKRKSDIDEEVKKQAEDAASNTLSLYTMKPDDELWEKFGSEEVKTCLQELLDFKDCDDHDAAIFEYWKISLKGVSVEIAEILENLRDVQKELDLNKDFGEEKFNQLEARFLKLKQLFNGKKRERTVLILLRNEYKKLRAKFFANLKEQKRVEKKILTDIVARDFNKNKNLLKEHEVFINEWELENNTQFLNQFVRNVDASEGKFDEIRFFDMFFSEEISGEISIAKENLDKVEETIQLIQSFIILKGSLSEDLTQNSVSIAKEKLEAMKGALERKLKDSLVVIPTAAADGDTPLKDIKLEFDSENKTKVSFSGILNFNMRETVVDCKKKLTNLTQQHVEDVQRAGEDYMKKLLELISLNEDWNVCYYAEQFSLFLIDNYFLIDTPFFLLSIYRNVLKTILERKENNIEKVINPMVSNMLLLCQICLVKQKRDSVLMDSEEKTELLQLLEKLRAKFPDEIHFQYLCKFVLESLKIFHDDGRLVLQIFGTIKLFDFTPLLNLLLQKRELLLQNKSSVNWSSWYKSFVINTIKFHAQSVERAQIDLIETGEWKSLMNSSKNVVILPHYIQVVGEICIALIEEHHDMEKFYLNHLLNYAEIEKAEFDVLKSFNVIPELLPGVEFHKLEKKILLHTMKFKEALKKIRAEEEDKKKERKKKKTEETIVIIEEGADILEYRNNAAELSQFCLTDEFVRCVNNLVSYNADDEKNNSGQSSSVARRIGYLRNLQYSNFLLLSLFKCYWNEVSRLTFSNLSRKKSVKNDLIISEYIKFSSSILRKLHQNINWKPFKELVKDKVEADQFLDSFQVTSSKYYFYSNFLRDVIGESGFLNFKLNLKEAPLCTFKCGEQVRGVNLEQFLKFIKSNSQVLLASKGGTGKSCLWRFLTVHIKSNSDNLFPLFLKADLLAEKAKVLLNASFDDILQILQEIILESIPTTQQQYQTLQMIELKNEILKILKSEKLCFIIDGFDEICDLKRNSFIKLMMQSFTVPKGDSNSKVGNQLNIQKILLSSRPSAIENNEFVSFFRDFKIFQIEPLTKGNTIKLLERILDYNEMEKVSVIERYNSLKIMSEGNPLIAVLILKRLLETEKEDDSQLRTKFELYENILFSSIETDKMRYKEKEKSSDISVAICNSHWLMKCFSTVAYVIHRTGNSEKKFLLQLLNNHIDKVIGNEKWLSSIRNPIESIIDSLIKFSGLASIQGDLITFSHRTVQEFFCARFIVNASENKEICRLQEEFQKSESLYFSFVFDDNRTVIGKWETVYSFFNDCFCFPFKDIMEMLAVQKLLYKEYVNDYIKPSNFQRGENLYGQARSAFGGGGIVRLDLKDLAPELHKYAHHRLGPSQSIIGLCHQLKQGKGLQKKRYDIEMFFRSAFARVCSKMAQVTENSFSFNSKDLDFVICSVFQFYGCDITRCAASLRELGIYVDTSHPYFSSRVFFSQSGNYEILEINPPAQKHTGEYDECCKEFSVSLFNNFGYFKVGRNFSISQDTVYLNYDQVFDIWGKYRVKLLADKNRKSKGDEEEIDLLVETQVVKVLTEEKEEKLFQEMYSASPRYHKEVKISADLKKYTQKQTLREVFFFPRSKIVMHFFYNDRTLVLEVHKQHGLDDSGKVCVLENMNDKYLDYSQCFSYPEGLLIFSSFFKKFTFFDVTKCEFKEIELKVERFQQVKLAYNKVILYHANTIEHYQIDNNLKFVHKAHVKYDFHVQIANVFLTNSDIVVVVKDHFDCYHFFRLTSKEVLCTVKTSEILQMVKERLNHTGVPSRFAFFCGGDDNTSFFVKIFIAGKTFLFLIPVRRVNYRCPHMRVIGKFDMFPDQLNIVRDFFYFSSSNQKLFYVGKKKYKKKHKLEEEAKMQNTLNELVETIKELSKEKGDEIKVDKFRYFDDNGVVKYYGGVKGSGNKFHGYGVLYNQNGTKNYVGEFKNGKFDGTGTFFSSEMELSGTFVRGIYLKPDVEVESKIGVIYFEDGKHIEYEGEFDEQSGLSHGNGKKYYSYRPPKHYHEYEGQFSHGMRSGKGKLKFYLSVGQISEYEGEFYKDRKNGKGVYFDGKDIKYEGEFADDKYDGQGTLFVKGKKKYEGVWVNGVLKKGLLFDIKKTERKLYEGEFAPSAVSYRKTDFLLQGFGTYFDEDGSVYKGEFVGNQYCGVGELTLANGDVYSGGFKADKMHGEGKMVFKNGDEYQGQYVMGSQTGVGKLFFSGGGSFYGQFTNSVRGGIGVLLSKDGKTKSCGQFLNDMKHGIIVESREEEKKLLTYVEDKVDESKGEFSSEDREKYLGMYEEKKISSELVKFSKTTFEVGIHTGYGCDGCGTKPIVGLRYQCVTKKNFDFCSKCFPQRKEKFNMGAHDWIIWETLKKKKSEEGEVKEAPIVAQKKRCNRTISRYNTIEAYVCTGCVRYMGSNVKCVNCSRSTNIRQATIACLCQSCGMNYKFRKTCVKCGRSNPTQKAYLCSFGCNVRNFPKCCKKV